MNDMGQTRLVDTVTTGGATIEVKERTSPVGRKLTWVDITSPAGTKTRVAVHHDESGQMVLGIPSEDPEARPGQAKFRIGTVDVDGAGGSEFTPHVDVARGLMDGTLKVCR